jgi:acyl-CoA synthetase (AMP-forming)/AMP-acid ligase II
MSASNASVARVLQRRAREQPDTRAFGWWGEGEVESWLSYRELDERARTVAAALLASVQPGARALLVYPAGFDYLAAFFGCLYAGVVAVPVYPPDSIRLDRTLPRLQAIVADANAEVLLTNAAFARFAPAAAACAPEFGRLRWIATDALPCTSTSIGCLPSDPDLALLQYTSGSTGGPKGVALAHENLAANSAAIERAHGYDATSLMVAWVPPYHDMGLIGSIVVPVFVGFPCILMSPTAFLLRPVRWLEAIAATRATTSGGPNFAFELCTRKIRLEQRSKLDLSNWKLAYCGAEPVREETLRRFAETFAPCGFKPQAMYPCYGLAESTLMVCGVEHGTGASILDHVDGEASRRVVSMGRPVGDLEVAIVDPQRLSRCADGEIGELWVRGASVARGYWNRPDDTAQTFGARLADGSGPYLRTGDLGFVHGGEVYVTGRIKELILVRGRKHFPSDLEATVERVQWNTLHHRPGGSAAFAEAAGGEERVVLVVEIERRQRERRAAASPAQERRRGNDRRRRPFAYRDAMESEGLDYDAIVHALRQAVAAEHGVELYAVVLTRPGAIPKTSSGKKQRLACRHLALGGSGAELVLHTWRLDGQGDDRRWGSSAQAGA